MHYFLLIKYLIKTFEKSFLIAGISRSSRKGEYANWQYSMKSITWENPCNKLNGLGVTLSKIKICVLTNVVFWFP